MNARMVVVIFGAAMSVVMLAACGTEPRRYRPVRVYNAQAVKGSEKKAEPSTGQNAATSVSQGAAGSKPVEVAKAEASPVSASRPSTTSPTPSTPPPPAPPVEKTQAAVTPGAANASPPVIAVVEPRVVAAPPSVPAAGELPSLQDEFESQARREADKLKAKTGVGLDLVKAAPVWAAKPDKGGDTEKWSHFSGKAKAQSLEAAYAAAVKSAQLEAARATAAAKPVDIARGVFQRSSLGDFTVWILVRQAK